MKIGDRIRIVETDFLSPELANGREGTVTMSELGIVVVKLDEESPMHPNHDWAFFESQLEVI